MTITSSGAVCDICGSFILPGMSDSVNPFKCKGVKEMLHCHDDCKPKVLEALKTKDWKMLPRGPLRMAFEQDEKKGEKNEKTKD